jgi:hypothetical protein
MHNWPWRAYTGLAAKRGLAHELHVSAAGRKAALGRQGTGRREEREGNVRERVRNAGCRVCKTEVDEQIL